MWCICIESGFYSHRVLYEGLGALSDLLSRGNLFTRYEVVNFRILQRFQLLPVSSQPFVGVKRPLCLIPCLWQIICKVFRNVEA